METPSFLEDHISQLPALELLMKLGYQYLSPEEAMAERGGRSSNVLLEGILKKQLQTMNVIEYKDKSFPFSDSNINTAILALRDLPVQDGFLAASQAFYDLVTLGKSMEQTVLGDKKSFSFHYIDWKHPENNVFHVTEEFSVARNNRSDHYRPDIVLFVNGIPLAVIECKSPRLKEPCSKAIEQHLRNQQEDGIRSLYQYSGLTLALAVHEARYGTTATEKEFWGVWRESFRSTAEQTRFDQELLQLKNESLPSGERALLFKDRYRSVYHYFEQQQQELTLVTEQDKLLYSCCRPERLLELVYYYTLFDDGVKKIARYQQYFAVRDTLKKVKAVDNGKRTGGVIWHTQGSGKSLTMVMMAQQLAMHPEIRNPKIILVTDRIDLDDQITDTFRKCGKQVRNATKGTSKEAIKKSKGLSLSEKELEDLNKDTSLLGLLLREDDSILTTIINKFESATQQMPAPLTSPDIFVLVDEGHRSHYGPRSVKMRKAFPNACFIAFTGTPLMKKEKSTAEKFGGIIDVYSITDAVNDKAVVPLLYEGRHNVLEVNASPLDTFFNKVSEPLTPYGKASLKKKFSTKAQLNKADQVIYARAWDISEHFVANFQGTGLKAQLVVPSKATAIVYKEYMDQIGRVKTEVLISAPDLRESEEDAFEKSEDSVKRFWTAMMDKYGKKPELYEKSLISAFKKQDTPEIIIVVSKLLTGFDAPRNTVMYLTRQLTEHTLLQAIARVNRLYPGKDYGYIIDYYGNLENLDQALNTYSGLNDFEDGDLDGTLTNISKEIEKLPQAHSELWDVFKTIRNKYDETAYEELLSDEALRYGFYEKLSRYARLLKLAYSSLDFVNKTPEQQIKKYKRDAQFFLELRIRVKRRYSDEADFAAYEAQVQKLIDKHITTEGEVLKITQLVNIFDKEQRESEVEKITGKAAKADHIASRTVRAISMKMDEDPVFYKRLSELIKATIADYHQHRINEAEFLKKAMQLEDQFLNGRNKNIPEHLAGNDTAISFYNLLNAILDESLAKSKSGKEIAGEMAAHLDSIFRNNVYQDGILIVDWENNKDLSGRIKIDVEDYLFDSRDQFSISIETESMDALFEECMKVAKVKFKV